MKDVTYGKRNVTKQGGRHHFCQDVATALAKLCRYVGKTLPLHWQDVANTLAELCQCVGKAVSMVRKKLFDAVPDAAINTL